MSSGYIDSTGTAYKTNPLVKGLYKYEEDAIAGFVNRVANEIRRLEGLVKFYKEENVRLENELRYE